jgi:hypothetical protein
VQELEGLLKAVTSSPNAIGRHSVLAFIKFVRARASEQQRTD